MSLRTHPIFDFSSLALIALTFALGPVAHAAKEKPKASAPAPYDEVYDDQGRIRPQYQAVYSIYSRMSEKERKEYDRQTYAAFRQDNRLDVVPRVFTKSERDLLADGVRQRGTALRMFLQDYYSGRRSYRAVVPEKVFDDIFARNGESRFLGKVRPDQISFPYGPDIVRTPDGTFHVIEDNPGFIGGPGDLKIARESLFKYQPDYVGVLKPLDDPMDYYKGVIAQARARAIPKDGAIVMYSSPPYADNEDPRMQKIFRDLGVITLTNTTRQKLVVKEDGVYIQSPDKIGKSALRRVGYLMLNTEHKYVDSTFEGTLEQIMVNRGREVAGNGMITAKEKKAVEAALITDPLTGRIDLDRLANAIEATGNGTGALRPSQSIPGLMEAIFQGKVATNYSPGVDSVGDKGFYVFVDKLIEHYGLGKPIIPNLPTRWFSKPNSRGRWVLDEKLFAKTFADENYKKFVFKRVDGRGGDAVWLGTKLSPAEINRIKRKIEAEPQSFILQELTQLSVLDRRLIVDTRGISLVGPRSVFVSPTFWSRGIAIGNKTGKVNLSLEGLELPVVVVKDPPATVTCVTSKLRRR